MRFLIAQTLSAGKIRTFEQLNFLIPDANRTELLPGRSAGYQGPQFIKTHSTDFQNFPKVIYLYRDPRDVMISYYEYLKDSSHFQGCLPSFLQDPITQKVTGCSWEEHLGKAFLFQKKFPDRICCVRYEDLLKSPTRQLGRVMAFAGLKPNEDTLILASEKSTFPRLQNLEKKSPESPRYARRFFRAGTSGQWKTRSAVEKSALETHFSTALKKFPFTDCDQQ